MALLRATDVLFRDLLMELHLNPVWEKYRGRLLVASIVCSLFPVTLTLSGLKLRCLPGGPPETASVHHNKLIEVYERVDMTVSEMEYTNALCSANQGIFNLNGYATFTLCIVFVIIASSAFWLDIKDVALQFKKFDCVRQKFLEIDLPIAEVIKLCSKAISRNNLNSPDGKSLENVRELCYFVVTNPPKKGVYRWYIFRCVWILIVMAGACIFSYFMRKYSHTRVIKCQLDDTIFPGKTVTNFTCVIKNSQTIETFTVLFAATITLQMVVVVVGLCYVMHCSLAYSKQFGKAFSLMILFWEYAFGVKCSDFKALIQYMCSNVFESAFRNQMQEIYDKDDFQLVEIKSKIFGKAPEIVSFLSKNMDRGESFINTEKYIKCLKVARYSIHDMHSIALVRKLRGSNQWELLIYLLLHSDLRSESKAKVTKMKSHLTESSSIEIAEGVIGFIRSCDEFTDVEISTIFGTASDEVPQAASDRAEVATVCSCSDEHAPLLQRN